MSHITTHVLDNATGRPAEGVGVVLKDRSGEVLGESRTDVDGRVGRLGPEELPVGTYQLVFATGEYFAAAGTPTFFPEVVLTFAVGSEDHYHVPLLLSPFAYSAYRGS